MMGVIHANGRRCVVQWLIQMRLVRSPQSKKREEDMERGLAKAADADAARAASHSSTMAEAAAEARAIVCTLIALP